jgi:hypothetical protein
VTTVKYIDSVGKRDKNMLLREEKNKEFNIEHQKYFSYTLEEKRKRPFRYCPSEMPMAVQPLPPTLPHCYRCGAVVVIFQPR